jgi:hypothetical protein
MISDALLIFFPLRTLRQLKDQTRLRQRLQAIFAASAFTTCASIANGAVNLSKIEFGITVTISIEVCHVLSLSLSFAAFFKSGRAALLMSSLTISIDTELGLPHGLQLRCSRHGSPQGLQHQTRPNNILCSWWRSERRAPSAISIVFGNPGQTGDASFGAAERSGGVELSKLSVTVDLELADTQSMSMARTKSPSPPPQTMFDGQQVDTGV